MSAALRNQKMSISKIAAVTMFVFGTCLFLGSLWSVHPGLVTALAGVFIAGTGFAGIKDEFF